ncbi:thioredoxin-disulfide reductase [Candidatus Beckwithbacteria bacterium]|nr:thioredoxin-disulfide reductase [Candidatus Beckwithbacteria bacterium]
MTKHKVIIIGSGPSGYAAAIYLARAKLKPLLFAGNTSGGQLMFTREVENFPGFDQGIDGPRLMMQMRAQAEKFGTQIIDGIVDKVDFSKTPFEVWRGEEVFLGQTILISTGAEAIRLNLPNENQFFGRGISACAVCDAAFYKDKIVYVVGGGDAACEDALALTRFAKEVFLVVRRDQLKASKVMQERVHQNPKITILWNSEVVELGGEGRLSKLTLKNNENQDKQVVEADGLFYAIGHMPKTDLFSKYIQIDEKGYIKTSLTGLSPANSIEHIWLDGYPTMTSKKGVFAAGDVVDFRYRQATTAVGMGVMAALDIERFLENQETK